jgi:probable rRNA maturation factor
MTARGAVEVMIESVGWRRRLRDAEAIARRAALAARRSGGASGTVAVVLSDDAQLRSLNRDFRGRDKPTNVLSFPADESGILGDVILALETCVREARVQGKTLRAHMLHLVVHGVLHLQGHDHRNSREAEAMEALERRILAGLGVGDPYVLRRRAS